MTKDTSGTALLYEERTGEHNVTTNNWSSHISFCRTIEAAHGIKDES